MDGPTLSVLERKTLLEMHEIEKSFPGVKALQGVSFKVRHGEVHGLVGENGAGKSTLMKILSGAYTADGGEIRLDGETITAPTPSDMIARGVAVIYQEFAQAEHLSVAENLFMNRMPRGAFGRIDWRKLHHDAADAMMRPAPADFPPQRGAAAVGRDCAGDFPERQADRAG